MQESKCFSRVRFGIDLVNISGTAMTDADANKQLDSIRNKSGRTSYYSEIFTYTWVIEEFAKCRGEKNSLVIVSPKIVINKFDGKFVFKLAMCPSRHTGNGCYHSYLDLKVLSCPNDTTMVCVRRCAIRSDGTEYDPTDHVLLIEKNAVFKNYYIDSDDISSCLYDGNLTVKCIFTFRCSVSRDKPEYPSLNAAKSAHDEFAELLYSGKFSDLTLDLGEKKFKVHKNILAARSPVFSAMFDHDMLENKENVVKITDVEPDIMSEVLLFIYANKVNSIKELTAGIFAAADKYQLEALRIMCEDVFLDKLSLNNLAEILEIVDEYQTCPRLRDAVLQFLSFNANEVANWENFDTVMKTLSSTLLFEVTKATMLKS